MAWVRTRGWVCVAVGLAGRFGDGIGCVVGAMFYILTVSVCDVYVRISVFVCIFIYLSMRLIMYVCMYYLSIYPHTFFICAYIYELTWQVRNICYFSERGEGISD